MKGDTVNLDHISTCDLLRNLSKRAREEDQPWVVVESLLALVSDRDISHLGTLVCGQTIDRRIDNEDPEEFKFACCPDEKVTYLQQRLWGDE